MIDEQVSYATRRKLQAAGVPFDQVWDKQGRYLAHMFEHRMAGKTTSVAAACEAAGFSPDALRQRRRHSAEFAAAERFARRGEAYVPLVTDEVTPDVVVDPLTYVTNTSWPPRPAPPQPLVDRPLATGPTNTVLAPKPPDKPKAKPNRRWGVPHWVPVDGYYHG